MQVIFSFCVMQVMNSAQNLPIYWNVGTGFQTTLRTLVGFHHIQGDFSLLKEGYQWKKSPCKYAHMSGYKCVWNLVKVKRWTCCSTKGDEGDKGTEVAFTLSSKVVETKNTV